jgi:hypothetical protein
LRSATDCDILDRPVSKNNQSEEIGIVERIQADESNVETGNCDAAAIFSRAAWDGLCFPDSSLLM